MTENNVHLTRSTVARRRYLRTRSPREFLTDLRDYDRTTISERVRDADVIRRFIKFALYVAHNKSIERPGHECLWPLTSSSVPKFMQRGGRTSGWRRAADTYVGEQDGDLPRGFPNEAAIQRIHVPSTTPGNLRFASTFLLPRSLLSARSRRSPLRVCVCVHLVRGTATFGSVAALRTVPPAQKCPHPVDGPTHGSENFMRCTRARERATDHPTADRNGARPRVLAGNPFKSLAGNRDACSVSKLINGNTRPFLLQ